MSTRDKTLIEIHNNRMWTIKNKMLDLLELGGGSVEWVAAQDKDRESREYWGVAIVMKEVFEHDSYVDFFIPKEDFDTFTDDELANRFAEHIIGCPVGSAQDIERKRRYANKQIEDCERQAKHWQKQVNGWQEWLADLEQNTPAAHDESEDAG